MSDESLNPQISADANTSLIHSDYQVAVVLVALHQGKGAVHGAMYYT